MPPQTKTVKAKRVSPRKSRKKFTVIDLFSGAGGTGLGFKNAGFRIAAAVELDSSAADTYENNLGVKVKRIDIRKLDPADFRRALKLKKYELDVLVGCPPCQGFTRLRNRKGAGDPRNSLVVRYLDYVKEFAPKYAVFENVPGLLRTRHGKLFFARLKKGLRALGYHFECHEVNAADYGVPQHRLRVLVIAARSRKPPALPSGAFADPQSSEVRSRRKKAWRTTRQAIGNGQLRPVRVGTKPRHRTDNHVPAQTGEDVLKFIRRVPTDGGSRTDVPKRNWLTCHKEHDGHYDTYGRLSWDEPANTITSGCTNPSKGRFAHPTQTRALTVKEAALLQGFPKSFRFHGQSQAKQVGNAVPPQLAAVIGESLKEQLRLRAA